MAECICEALGIGHVCRAAAERHLARIVDNDPEWIAERRRMWEWFILAQTKWEARPEDERREVVRRLVAGGWM